MSKDLLDNVMGLKDEIEKKLVELNELIDFVDEKSEELMDAIDEYEDDKFISCSDDISDEDLDQISNINICYKQYDNEIVELYDNDFNFICSVNVADLDTMFGKNADEILNGIDYMDIVSVNMSAFVVESFQKGWDHE